MKCIRHSVMLLVSLMLAACGLNFAFTPSASADTGFCTGANQSIDPVSGNCVTSTLTEGSLKASVNESLKGKAYLKLVTSGNVVLNVHTQPIPKQLIKRCWTVKPGTWIINQVRNTQTGQLENIRWQVPVGDNTFCTEKGHGHQVFKKSCNNKTWNVPGQPTQPPAPKAIVKGRFTVVNYVKWEAVLLAMLSKHLAGSLSVESPDHTCQASSSFDNDVLVKIYLKALFKSRTKAAAHATAVRRILIKAQSGTKASGKLTAKITLKIKNKLSAMCNTSVPPSLPVPPTVTASANGCVGGNTPNATVNVSAADTNKDDTSVTFVFDSQPSKTVQLTNSQASASFTVNSAGSFSGKVTGNPSGLSAAFSVTVQPCAPPQVAKPTVQACQINQVLENNQITCTVTGTVADGHTATLISTARNGGTITSNKSVTVSGSFSVKVGYTAPGEIPPANSQYGIAAGKDRIDFLVNQDDGQQATDTTNQFDIVAPTPDPL